MRQWSLICSKKSEMRLHISSWKTAATAACILSVAAAASNPRIAKGVIVPSGSTNFPYHVTITMIVGRQDEAITKPLYTRGGGSLISLKVAITMAEFLFSGHRDRKAAVFAGMYNACIDTSYEPTRQMRYSKSWHVHPMFDHFRAAPERQQDFDIGLVVLEKPFDRTPYVRPLWAYNKGPDSPDLQEAMKGRKVIIVGFGKFKHERLDDPVYCNLRSSLQKLLPKPAAESKTKNQLFFRAVSAKSGYPNQEHPCNRDEGGGFVIRDLSMESGHGRHPYRILGVMVENQDRCWEHGKFTRAVSVFESQVFIKAASGINVTVMPPDDTLGASKAERRKRALWLLQGLVLALLC